MKYLVLLLVVAGAIAGCENASESSTKSLGPALNGFVVLKDSMNRELRNHSGVRVQVLGRTQSATTDEDGQWNLYGFPTDTPFTLVFTKTGFAEERHPNFIATVPAGGNIYYGLMRMYAIRTLTPSLVLRAFEDLYGGSNPTPLFRAVYSIRISEFDKDPTLTAQCMIFFGKSAAISAANPATYAYNTILRQTSTDGVAYFDIYADSLYANGFTKGEKVFCAGYAAGHFSGPSYYVDPATSKQVFTGFSPLNSSVKSFILP